MIKLIIRDGATALHLLDVTESTIYAEIKRDRELNQGYIPSPLPDFTVIGTLPGEKIEELEKSLFRISEFLIRAREPDRKFNFELLYSDGHSLDFTGALQGYNIVKDVPMHFELTIIPTGAVYISCSIAS